MITSRIFFFITCLLLVSGLAFAAVQDKNGSHQNSGFKRYIRNYYREDYDGGAVLSILQGKRGIIYVGGEGGLREFDGVSWRSINVSNHWVISMAVDDNGTIYIGGKNEIGYLAPDAIGSLKYKSLVQHLKENQTHFDVLRVHATKKGIYFNTGKYLFRWDANARKIKVWEPDQGFHLSFTCEGKLFIQQVNVGLQQMENDSLQLIPGDEKFAAEKILMMIPCHSKTLIGTRSNRLYLYDGMKAVPFPAEADDFLEDRGLFHGIGLSSGDVAVATAFGGLAIIDPQGRLIEIFNKSSGLLDNLVKYVYEDFQGNLWLLHEPGISKIEYASPVSIYDDRSNLPGKVLTVVRHKNNIYAGTESGLYSLAPDGKFRPVPGMSNTCWSLLSPGDFFLAATSDGVFQVGNQTNVKIIGTPSHFLLQSQKDKKLIWVGTSQGLFALYNENGRWVKQRAFEETIQFIYEIAEDKNGNLWLVGTISRYKKGTMYHTREVLIGYFSGGSTMFRSRKLLSKSHLFPSTNVRVFMAAGHVIFATDKGIFRYDEKNKVFIPDLTFENELVGISERKSIRCLVEDINKNIWFNLDDDRCFQAVPQPGGAFVIQSIIPFRFPPANVNCIYPDPNGDILWLARNNGLIRYDIKLKKNNQHAFSTLIRKVLANGTLIFGGSHPGIDHGFKFKRSHMGISYQDRNLYFEFAAPFFEAESQTEYRYLLEGYEKDWSDWTWETKKDYTSLEPGQYRFRVQAKNVYGNFSDEAVFQFKILLPWYRTWWAFLSYGLVFFMLTYLVVKWRRSFQLEQEKQRLEQTVKERTREIREMNQQLKEQSQKLKEMDKVKSRFFANISHEFRTPLTLIMGPLEQMLSTDNENGIARKKKLTLMLRNTQRLLGLINQLLELSKFESGKVKFRAYRQNIILFLKGITASFEPVAFKNELDLTFHAEEENITIYFDPGKLEEIIFNLLSNAVKFTPARGKITITAAKNPIKEANFPSGSLDISIGDTGPGIPREQLPHIFDRFYQSDSTYEHHQKGSGIGLAIAKELVELHGGKIAVYSSEGKNSGTTFIVRLPIGDAHLKPEEIGEPGEKPYQPRNPQEIPGLYMIEKEQGVPADVKTPTADSDETDMTPVEKDFLPLKPERDIILVVEDSADFRDYIRECLEPFYAVVEAVHGGEGIQKAQEIIPDLIISDIMMPETDGYELCRVLKDNIQTSHIPIILLTAKASHQSMIQGLETGADDYITKPFNSEVLYARIKNLIRLRRQLQFKRRQQMTLEPTELSVASVDEKFYQELQDVIEKNLSDPDLNVEQLAKKLYMSRTTLYRKIMALTGESPNQFMRSYRLKRAAQLLEANFGNVTEVAVKVGFSNMAYFSQCFREKFHQSPSTYQARESES